MTESQFGRATVDGLVQLARDLSQTSDLPTMLTIFVQAISDVAHFECAAISLVEDAGDLAVVAVAGRPELEDALLGTVGSRTGWEAELARAERYGAVHLTREVADDHELASWISDESAWFDRTAGEVDAWRPAHAMFVPMHDPDGALLGIVSVDLPRSGRVPDHAQMATLEVLARQLETAVSAAQRLARTSLDEHIFASVFEVSGSAMCIADESGRLTQTNRRFREVFGDLGDVDGFDALVTQVERARGLSAEVRATFDHPVGERDFVVATGAPDDPSWFHVTVRGVTYTGSAPVRAVCTMSDITGERRTSRRFQHDAEHDMLTGLLNRRGVRETSSKVVAACPPDGLLVVMFCDLDGFKRANDLHGHQFGDQVLCDVAVALREAAPEPAVLGRVGGDEFIVLASCVSIHEAQKLADSVVRSVRVPIPGSADLVVTTSVGVAMDDSAPHRSISELMQDADEALYRSKLAGGSRWVSAPMA